MVIYFGSPKLLSFDKTKIWIAPKFFCNFLPLMTIFIRAISFDGLVKQITWYQINYPDYRFVIIFGAAKKAHCFCSLVTTKI
jgi:hypothetical protein